MVHDKLVAMTLSPHCVPCYRWVSHRQELSIPIGILINSLRREQSLGELAGSDLTFISMKSSYRG